MQLSRSSERVKTEKAEVIIITAGKKRTYSRTLYKHRKNRSVAWG